MMRVVSRWNRWKKSHSYRTRRVRIGEISAWLTEGSRELIPDTSEAYCKNLPPYFFMVHLLHRLYGVDVLPVAVGCTLYLTDYQVKQRTV